MNETNMNKIIAAIEQYPEHFNMTTVYNGGASPMVPVEQWRCGSSACVLGWGRTLLFVETGQLPADDLEVYQWLGLSWEAGNALCFPGDEQSETVWGVPDAYAITAQQAAERLRYLTSIDWGNIDPDRCEICGEQFRPNDERAEMHHVAPDDSYSLICHAQCGLNNGMEVS